MKWIKYLLILVAIGGLVYFGFAYTILNGNPIEKASLKDEAQDYLDQKYNREMVVKEGTFNVNIGYGATAHPKDEPQLTFQLYRNSEGDWTDHYPSTLWEKQLKEDVLPKIEQEYPNANKDLTATFAEYYKGGTVPDYETVDYSFMAQIQSDKHIGQQNEEEELKKMLNLVQYWKNLDLQGGFKVDYENKTYRFTSSEIEQINSIQDLKTHADHIG